MKNNSIRKIKGFTLIELLIVVAIIAILSAIILASLNSARDNGKDGSARSSMSSVRSASEAYYAGNTYSYSGLCVEPEITKLLDAAKAQTGHDAVCQVADTNDSFTAYDLLTGGQYFCVDSQAFVGEIGTDDPAGGTPPAGFESGVKCK